MKCEAMWHLHNNKTKQQPKKKGHERGKGYGFKGKKSNIFSHTKQNRLALGLIWIILKGSHFYMLLKDNQKLLKSMVFFLTDGKISSKSNLGRTALSTKQGSDNIQPFKKAMQNKGNTLPLDKLSQKKKHT